MDEHQLTPLGHFRSPFKNFLEAPRQPTHEIPDSYIELLPQHQFEQALEDLDGFDRIWVIFQFHLKNQWRPKVMPPRGSLQKRGVFATRSPLRPNNLGLSCLQLKKISGLKVFVTGSDLLEGTPIFDIKPYLPYTDSFPNAKTGWLEGIEKDRFQIIWSESVLAAKSWLALKCLFLDSMIENQLEFDPMNAEKKRVRPADIENEWIFSYRTWRILFKIQPLEKKIIVLKIFSGYSESELCESADPYQDKNIHLEFIKLFGRELV